MQRCLRKRRIPRFRWLLSDADCQMGVSVPNGLGLDHDDHDMLTQAAGGDVFPSVPSLVEGLVLMSIYKEFMIILTTVNVIIAILTYLHKK